MQILRPEGMHHSPRYYSAVKAGNMIFVAGRVPLDVDGNVVAPNDAATQTTHIMREIERLLAEGGATLRDIVMMHTYYLSQDDMPAIFEARQRIMGDHYPPHTGVRMDSASWIQRGIRLEIEVTAMIEG